MSFLSKALSLAEKGFYVFPVQPGGKLPVIDDFPNRATRDPEQIKKFWIDPVMGWEQPFNIGISTTKFNGNQALVVVDVDNKNKKSGDNELEKLIKKGKLFPKTFTQKTPSGGRHLIYRAKAPVKQGTNVLGPGLDIRSKGGYILAEGSVIDGKMYEVEDSDITSAECPEWVTEQCGTAFTKVIEEKEVKPVNQETAEVRATKYLKNDAPISIEGESGDQTAYKVAAVLKDLGADKDLAVGLMLEHWNERCVPPWSPEQIEAKVRNAYAYGVNPQGMLAPDRVFTEAETYDKDNFLEKMNERYAIIFNGGTHSILFETSDEKGNSKREFLQELTFKRKFSPNLVQQGKGAAKSYADLWLDWPGRRTYNGVCFSPGREPANGYYNLWRGFRYTPKSYAEASAPAREGFNLFMSHVKENMCGNNESLFTWLMGYFAHMIQKPYERPLTTLVFRGAKGVGKNVAIDRVGNLLGPGHYLVAHDGRYLTSNFNGHLDSCLCLVLDEAFWSGDKQAEGKLKGITTSPTIMIERKGREPYQVDNLTRLVVIGNEDWLVPASYDERRYAVLDVGEGKKQNREYFNRMRILMDEKGGAEILLKYLMDFDLNKVDVNLAPATIGLLEQKLESMEPLEQFWLQCLREGTIRNSSEHPWPERISKAEMRDAVAAYWQQRNIKSWRPTDEKIGRVLKKLNPSIVSNQKVKVGSEYKWAYALRDLDYTRAEWCKSVGFTLNWEN